MLLISPAADLSTEAEPPIKSAIRTGWGDSKVSLSVPESNISFPLCIGNGLRQCFFKDFFDQLLAYDDQRPSVDTVFSKTRSNIHGRVARQLRAGEEKCRETRHSAERATTGMDFPSVLELCMGDFTTSKSVRYAGLDKRTSSLDCS